MLENYNPVHEKRLVNRLQAYWESLREGEHLPAFSKFNQNYVADMWESCLLFYVSHNGEQKLYHCESVGKQLTLGFGHDLKDIYISSRNKMVLPGANLMQYMDKAITDKSFVMSSGQFINYRNKVVKYRDCILPFIDHSENITHLIIGISWREFD